MKTRRAYALMLCLWLTLLLVIGGLAFLGMRSTQYRGAMQSSYAEGACALAQAGLADARMKFWKDPDFPPPGAIDQDHFSYSEPMEDLDGNPIGFYRVDISLAERALPKAVILVRSCGVLTRADGTVLAQRRLTAELDVAPLKRDGSGGRNPRFYDWCRYQDEAGW